MFSRSTLVVLLTAVTACAQVAEFIEAGIGGRPDSTSISAQPVGISASSTVSIARPRYSNTTSIATSREIQTRASITGASIIGDCYSSWNNFWSASRASYDQSLSIWLNDPVWSSSPTATVVHSTTVIKSAFPGRTITFGGEQSYLSYEVAGGHTLATATVHTTESTVYIIFSSTPESDSTGIVTETLYTTFAPQNVSVPPTPTCSLPPVVPQCQSSWEKWITTQLVPAPTPPPHCDVLAGQLNNRTVPACAKSWIAAESSYSSYIGVSAPTCRAASISGIQCQSVRDNYQMDENYAFKPKMASDFIAFAFSQGTIGGYTMDTTTTYVWPTSSTLGSALGCTLGCGRCGITGGTVQLLYWPTATAAPSIGASSARRIPSRVPSSSSSLPPSTVVTLGTTLTSPTVYISYQKVYASNACGSVGSEIGSTILAIPNPSALSSVYAITVPCDAHMRPTQVYTQTAPFTLEDLYQQPVPYSIYSSQPTCQTWLRYTGHCGGVCPTTEPYKPILVVPDELLKKMQPAWSNCWGDIRGVYDPPIALTATAAPDGPEITNSPVPVLSQVVTSTIVSVVRSIDDPASQRPTSEPSPQTTTPKNDHASTRPANDPPSETTNPRSDPADPKVSTGKVAGQADPTVRTSNGQQDLAGSALSPATTIPLPSPGSDLQTTIFGSLTLTVSRASSSGVVVVGGNGITSTLTAGAAIATIAGQIFSIDPSGLVIQSYTAASPADPGPTGPAIVQSSAALEIVGPDPTVLGSGTAAVTVSEFPGGSSAVLVVGGSSTTVAAGASTLTLNGQTISVGNSGIVVLGGVSSVTTFTAPTQADMSPAPTVVTIGSQSITLREISAGSSVVLVENGLTTTLAMGSTAMVNSQQVSIGSSGIIVFGSGSAATTVTAPIARSTSTTSVGSKYTGAPYKSTGNVLVPTLLACTGIFALLLMAG